ncbi:hypothetical protein [Ruegeria sp. MALMAid1280]|uniref:hypothetical protein n=1 Tax=Ruegeria sp. MALMAid1280 TaxID=3411634 RepID=UPI003B9EFAF3
MHSEELFRFVAVRAPRARRRPIDSLTLVQISPFTRTLLDNLRDDRPRVLALATIDRFLEDEPDRLRGDDDPIIAGLVEFHRRVLRERPEDNAAATELARETLGDVPAVLVSQSDYLDAVTFARDVVLALKVRSDGRPGRLAHYTRAMQAADLIRVLASDSDGMSFAEMRAILRAPISLPDEFDALRERETDFRVEAEPEAPDRAPEVAQLAALERAVTELAAATGSLERRDGGADSPARLNLSRAASNRLSLRVRNLLDEEDIDVERDDFVEVLDAVVSRRNALATTLAPEVDEEGDDDEGRFVLANAVMPVPSSSPALPMDPSFADPTTMPPTTIGPLRPTGVGSLLKVRQQIKRYEASDISHVQNVMRSESRNRSTRRLRRTEETFLIEEENTTEEERNLQSTDRFEMKTEMERTLSNSREFSVGATVSAGYGPFVQVEASTEFGTSSSSEQVERTASSFARELTEQTASRITQRRRTQRSTTTLEEFEENNSHGFDNTSGDSHAIGVYQWLDRIYDMQVYDYGLRMMFDFTVLEPSTMYLKAVESQIVKPGGMKEPKKFKLRPDEITESNYTTYVARYAAEGVEAPPPLQRTLAHSFSHSSPDGNWVDHSADAMLIVPEGYRAFRAQAAIMIDEISSDALPPSFGGGEETFAPPSENRVDILVAKNRLFKVQREDETTEDQVDAFSHAEGDLPLSVNAVNIRTFAATVTIDCIRTPRAMEQWQLTTHEALTRAYHARRAEYEERLATLAVSQEVQPEGRNPTFNRIIERNELRRISLIMLTGQRFKSTSVPLSPQAAEFDFQRMLRSGRYAQFWETAIDWQNMDYQFLPYYWARQSTWGRLLTENADPIHAEFIRAGAVRIRLSVTPGFEAAILHFLETGGIWSGGELPEVTTPGYIAFLDEIAERRDEEETPATDLPLGGGPPTEVPWGLPWEIRLPTTLVRLRPDDTLPEWEQMEDGTWQAVN